MTGLLDSKYNSKEVEAKWYTLWESKGYFKPQSNSVPGTAGTGCSNLSRNVPGTAGKYVIVIPPPNVTGILHVGHALNNSIQDILIRWNRMKGLDTLWVPGVDHAGIATQNVVEKKLAKEGIKRQALGREKFLEKVWEWKNEYGDTITRQLRRLGASCDWSRERFTMDEGLSKAVREAFVSLYERGLIYQGDYIINWCPRCQTALSDEEAEHRDVEGGLYHIKYPIIAVPGTAGTGCSNLSRNVPGTDFIVVATTRPETMLGDTAVAVNPEDERYKHLHGKKLILPLVNREIPIITDTFVDPQFGTGMVKVTPAHDPNDFEMGNRHNLERVNVLTPDGHINENGGVYKGLERFAARKKIIEDLEAQGLFIKKDKHKHAVGHCYRCHTVVEPYLSKQWFVKMKPLAEKALKAHSEGKTTFYPDRWTKVYTNWLEGIRDWCISRQIWWGHQVPVWYCDDCLGKRNQKPVTSCQSSKAMDHGLWTMDAPKGLIVSRETPAKCPHCGNTNLRQDPDVLDTWFSSWLWPFSTLGWPASAKAPAGKPAQSVPGTAGPERYQVPCVPGSENPAQKYLVPEGSIVPGTDLAKFYPTSDLVTAAEIIFFWVARMIMAGLEFMGEVPFSRIYIHGTVRAEGGLKMSKSLGNSIDPLEVIDEMGADALRLSMIMLSAQDVYLSREKFEVGRNFTNKLWNASRFVLMKLGEDFQGKASLTGDVSKFSLPNRWILSRASSVIRSVEKQLGCFSLAQATTELYHFVWNDFCDWYIELVKPELSVPGTLRAGFEEPGTEVPGTAEETRQVLFYVLEKILRMLHPVMPFITEEIWNFLKGKSSDADSWPESVMLAKWPLEELSFMDSKAEHSVEWLQTAVTGIRDLRSRVNLPPSQTVKAVVVTQSAEVKKVFEAFGPQMKVLGRLEALSIQETFEKSKSWIGNPFSEFEVYIFIEGLVNPEEERKRIQKKIQEVEGWIKSINTKLSNHNFVQNAPPEVVGQERIKLADAQKLLASNQDLMNYFT